MANSRVLVECMAELTRQPLSRVVGHMRSLREAEPNLVTNKGRGVTAPSMTPHDAATLLCAIFAAPNIQESASTIVDLRKLPPKAQGRSRSDRSSLMPDRYLPRVNLELGHDHTVIDGLAAAIRFFMNEDEYRREWHQHGTEPELYARFVVRSPEHSASLSVGARGHFSEEWIYGRAGELDAFRTGQCSEITLRKLAACLKA